MSDQSNPPADYLLGEMAANIRSIDQNVAAMRAELGDLGRRLGHAETELASIQSERRAMLPEYIAFMKSTRSHIEETNAWKSRFDGGVTVAKGSGKVMHTILAAVGTLALFIAGQVWNAQHAHITGAVVGQNSQ